MGDRDAPPPISNKTLNNLNDKLYDKRKQGALELEEQVKTLLASKDHEAINQIITYVVNNFCNSSVPNTRKGGLIALAAIAVALGPECPRFLSGGVAIVIRSLEDPDSRVRYYACESLYNIAKVARGSLMPHFTRIFDGLCKLAADPDASVRNGVQLLDRLLKDIMTEGVVLDLDKFMPLLSERIYVHNPFVRQFLISWLVVLDAVPDIDLIAQLPRFLDGLFVMLNDAKEEIRREADNLLSTFLVQVREAPTLDYGTLIKILVAHCSSNEELAHLRAVAWLTELIGIGRAKVLPYAHEVVLGVLPCLSNDSSELREAALRANVSLMELIKGVHEDDFAVIDKVLHCVLQQFVDQYVPTRIAALQWISVFYGKFPARMVAFLEELFPHLLRAVSDPSEEVVRNDLELMAAMSRNRLYFDKLTGGLLALFRRDHILLENRGALIVRQLSLYLTGEAIYRALAKLLEAEDDPEFASVIVQILNLILLTSPELLDVRRLLRRLPPTDSGAGADNNNDDAQQRPLHRPAAADESAAHPAAAGAAAADDESSPAELFSAIYRSWSHNPASLLSLCLLSQQYSHALTLVHRFGELEVTVNFLVEIDKLIQLIESPIFTAMRLHLLKPERYPDLHKCLYGLLMLMPQSSAYETLKNRLATVAPLSVLQLLHQQQGTATRPTAAAATTTAATNAAELPPFAELVANFDQVQDKHATTRLKARRALLSKLPTVRDAFATLPMVSASQHAASAAAASLPASASTGGGGGGATTLVAAKPAASGPGTTTTGGGGGGGAAAYSTSPTLSIWGPPAASTAGGASSTTASTTALPSQVE